MRDIDSRVYLTQTDTIVGFVSQDSSRLDEIKGRKPNKQYITALPSLKSLTSKTRVPTKHKNMVRRARRATFIFPYGESYRVIHDTAHKKLIRELGWAYTTSANQSGKELDETWARGVADVVIEPLENQISRPSRIFKLGIRALKKLR